MRRTIILAVLLVACFACGKRKDRGRRDDPMSDKSAPLMAGMKAPAGATPCDTTWNAVAALDASAKEHGTPPPWAVLPTREAFLAACLAIAPADQVCLQPRYQMANREACEPILRRLQTSDPAGMRYFQLMDR